MNIENRIRDIRESKRIKQTEVASALNMDNSQYAKLEKRGNKLSLEQVDAIANALGVSVAELIGINTSDRIDSSIEVNKLLQENENLLVRDRVLSNIESSYLDIFNEHLIQIEEEILNQSIGLNNFPFNLVPEDILDKNEKFWYLSFYLFAKMTDWYEIAIKLKIISDVKIVNAWERFKFINPLTFTLDDFRKYRISHSNNEEINENSIAIEIIKERARSIKYKYIEKEVTYMIEMFNSLLPNSDTKGMRTVSVKQLLTSKSEINQKALLKVIEKEAIESSTDKSKETTPFMGLGIPKYLEESIREIVKTELKKGKE